MTFYETNGLYKFHDLVSDKGKTGVCAKGCFPVPTTVLNGERLCSRCADDQNEKKYKYDEFDGTLKCPATQTHEGCGADQLSPREFWIGTCCEAASRWKNDHFVYRNFNVDDQMMKVLRKYYLETKKTFVAARRKSQNCRTDYLMMRKEVNELDRNAMKAELAAKVAREKATKAEDELKDHLKKTDGLRKRARTVEIDYEKTRKRLRFLSYEFPEVYERNCESDSVERSCPICFEDYTPGELTKHQESALPCGHRFCFFCIVDCKDCPTCRKSFTKTQIYKLF